MEGHNQQNQQQQQQQQLLATTRSKSSGSADYHRPQNGESLVLAPLVRGTSLPYPLSGGDSSTGSQGKSLVAGNRPDDHGGIQPSLSTGVESSDGYTVEGGGDQVQGEIRVVLDADEGVKGATTRPFRASGGQGAEWEEEEEEEEEEDWDKQKRDAKARGGVFESAIGAIGDAFFQPNAVSGRDAESALLRIANSRREALSRWAKYG